MPQKSNKNQKTQKHEGQGWLSFFFLYIMHHLPNEIIFIILGFLPNDSLIPITNELKPLYQSNIVWKPRLVNRFGEIYSKNYFREYQWCVKLERHIFMHKRAYTYGCVGKNIPPVKPVFQKSIF